MRSVKRSQMKFFRRIGVCESQKDFSAYSGTIMLRLLEMIMKTTETVRSLFIVPSKY